MNCKKELINYRINLEDPWEDDDEDGGLVVRK